MLAALQRAGCPVDRRFFKVEACEAAVVGGFRPGDGVVVCHNAVQSATEFRRGAARPAAARHRLTRARFRALPVALLPPRSNMLVHELVHAFDHCRAALDWTDCEQVRTAPSPMPAGPRVLFRIATDAALPGQHACSEVRAANLSGDCSFGQELLRGNLRFTGQQAACVRRRATLSVAMNAACGKPGAAARAVGRAFGPCRRDTAPFDRAP